MGIRDNTGKQPVLIVINDITLTITSLCYQHGKQWIVKHKVSWKTFSMGIQHDVYVKSFISKHHIMKK